MLQGRGRGDQYVNVIVDTPKRLGKEERELFEQLAEFDGKQGRDRGLFERVRDIFN